MGKPQMVMKSSIKALHQSLCTLPPRAQTCLCVHQSQTDSFRLAGGDLFNDSIRLGKAEQERETENSRADLYCHHHLLPARDSTSFDESSVDPCSSSAASSSDSALDGLASSLSSKRFFFSPCTTNSILEEGKKEKEDGSDGGNSGGGGGGVSGDGVLELGKEERLPLGEESVTLSVNSEDPFQDFRASMEEMVEALDIGEWSGLQELLQCYLRLNEKPAHRFIICAFVDLIMNISVRTKEC